MNDFLVAYLDAIDEALLGSLDEEQEVSSEAVHHLRLDRPELLTGAIPPAHLVEERHDWFHLVPAFVAAYVADLVDLEELATLFDVVAANEDAEIEDAESGRA